MPKLKFKADQLAPLAVSVSLFPLLPPCFASSSRTVTIQLDLKFDYKMPSTKCAIGKHFSRARVWNLFWPTNNFSRFFFFLVFVQPLWEIVTVSKSFCCLPLICWPCHRVTFCLCSESFRQQNMMNIIRRWLTLFPPSLLFILCVTTVIARFIIT